MKTTRNITLLAVILAGAGLAAGCERTATDRTTSTTVDRTTSQVAANTEAAANKATTAVGDAAITGSVKAALIAEPNLKALMIDVDTKNGVVTLNGTVDNPEQKTRAVSVAQGVTGVSSVVDRLQTKSTG